MNKYTATQLNKKPNPIYNEATIKPVVIEHKDRGMEFVLMTKSEWDENNDLILELNQAIDCYEND